MGGLGGGTSVSVRAQVDVCSTHFVTVVPSWSRTPSYLSLLPTSLSLATRLDVPASGGEERWCRSSCEGVRVGSLLWEV